MIAFFIILHLSSVEWVESPDNSDSVSTFSEKKRSVGSILAVIPQKVTISKKSDFFSNDPLFFAAAHKAKPRAFPSRIGSVFL